MLVVSLSADVVPLVHARVYVMLEDRPGVDHPRPRALTRCFCFFRWCVCVCVCRAARLGGRRPGSGGSSPSPPDVPERRAVDPPAPVLQAHGRVELAQRHPARAAVRR